MDPAHESALKIFDPELLEGMRWLENGGRLVKYCSANAACSTIKHKKIWFRDARCQNDSSELTHGIKSLFIAMKANHTSDDGLAKIVDEVSPGLWPSIHKEISGLFQPLSEGVFLYCLSAHGDIESEEDQYGRLSMWRAYGGTNPVALVIKPDVLFKHRKLSPLRAFRVRYSENEDCIKLLADLGSRMRRLKKELKSLGDTIIRHYLREFFLSILLSNKHPGFREEKEWRIVYTPAVETNSTLSSSIETVNGTVQSVYKLSLENRPDLNIETGLGIPELLEKVIIGPQRDQEIVRRAFIELLREAKCSEPERRVVVSGIPLR